MVAGFRRSLSLPGSSPSSPARPSKGRPHKKSYHVRSTSLPCRSHPVISQVDDQIRDLRTWQSNPEPESGSIPTWICTGMSGLERLHASLDDLLHLPQSQDSIRHGSTWTERLLDDYLRLADVHGTFRSAVVALKQHQSGAQVANRRKDEAKLVSCIRSQRRAEKELAKLASILRDTCRSAPAFVSDVGEAELAGILRETATVTLSASVSVILAIAAASSAASKVVASTSSCSPSSSWMVDLLRKLSSALPSKKRMDKGEDEEGARRRALESMEGLQECLGVLESRSERVFRSVMNTRVSLLNVLTPSI